MRRLGVMSKVAVVPPKKVVESEEVVVPPKEVPSVVKVKPRVIPSNTPQANKNLLLKAVAEAQRSIAQTPAVGTNIKVIYYKLIKFLNYSFDYLINAALLVHYFRRL